MIILKNLSLRRSAKVLLDNASVSINPGEKVGLVGRNGAGKSSLFALINGTLHEDKGDFSMPSQWRMAQVAQDMPETDASPPPTSSSPATPRWRRRRPKSPRPRPATTASAWRTPTWRCTTPAPTTRSRARRR